MYARVRLASAIGLLGLAVLAGCGGQKGGGVCGDTVCGERETCDQGTSPLRCKCLPAYSGATCASCARGFMAVAGGCEPVTINCRANSGVCGSHGTCVSSGEGANDSCSCKAGYAGHACTTCDAGYQDNDNNGVCEPSCLSMATTCTPPQVCSDATGRRVCSCPGNRTGAACDQCPSGYVLRASDNTCVQTCTSIGSTCGTRKYCDDSSGIPVCQCMAAFAPPDCTGCAEGYLADGTGQCVRTAPAGTTLLGSGRWQNSDYLLAINPSAGSATPLRPLANLSGVRLATDLGGRVIYTVSGNVISKLDAMGKATAVVTLPSVQGVTFGAGALFSVGSIVPNVLTRVDPATGARSDLGATNLPGGQDQASLAWDGTGLLYARPPSTGATNGAELFRLDVGTAAAASLGAVPIDGARLRPSENRVGMAMDAVGELFLALRLGRTPQEVLTDHCRKTAAGLGYPGYEQAPFTLLEIIYDGLGSAATRSLVSANPSGKEIIAYASYGRRTNTKATMRIETTNPEAFVCVSSYEEVIELLVPAETARFAAVSLAGYRPILTLVVEGAVRDVTRPTLHVHVASGSVAPAFSAYSFVKVYTNTEWTQLKLPVYASAWDSDPESPAVLLQLDPATFMPLRQLSFPGIEIYPTIAPWAP